MIDRPLFAYALLVFAGIAAASALAQAPSPPRLEPLSALNTAGAESAPTIAGGHLVFARQPEAGADSLQRRSELMRGVVRADGSWSAVPFSYELNSRLHERGLALSPDGRLALVARETSDGGALVASRRGSLDFQAVESLPFGTPGVHDVDADFAPHGRGFVFASDRPGGLGGFDLYYVERVGAGWSAPMNLGEPVNSPADEVAPRWQVGDILTFASDRPGGLGGLDLFAVDISRDAWTDVQRLPEPWSSPAEDRDLVYDAARDRLYLSSDRGEVGNLDLYVGTTGESSPGNSAGIARIHRRFGVSPSVKNTPPSTGSLPGNPDEEGDGMDAPDARRRVRVVDFVGRAVEGARITALAEGQRRVWTTDATGRTAWDSLWAGAAVVVDADGYEPSDLTEEMSDRAAPGEITVRLAAPRRVAPTTVRRTFSGRESGVTRLAEELERFVAYVESGLVGHNAAIRAVRLAGRGTLTESGAAVLTESLRASCRAVLGPAAAVTIGPIDAPTDGKQALEVSIELEVASTVAGDAPAVD